MYNKNKTNKSNNTNEALNLASENEHIEIVEFIRQIARYW
jgi:hypothetical protein